MANREPSQQALVLPLKYFSAPELHQRSVNVADDDLELGLLIDHLIVTLRHHRGAGLSAPQVGILKRVAVVEMDEAQIILVNPMLVRHGRDKVVAKESCLSLPGVFVDVERFRLCEVESRGKKYNVANWVARCVQHELDHLDGVLITDKPYAKK